MTYKPFSQACERNKHPILQELQRILSTSKHILEIGSGTGQHAVYFGKNMPHLLWQTSDLQSNHLGINTWIAEANVPNVLEPICFDINQSNIPLGDFDAIFTANTFHIMSWGTVIKCIEKTSTMLEDNGIFIVYGPFLFNGKHTSLSNKKFHLSLQSQNSNMGIREFEDINRYCLKLKLKLIEKITMPANNFILVFTKNEQHD